MGTSKVTNGARCETPAAKTVYSRRALRYLPVHLLMVIDMLRIHVIVSNPLWVDMMVTIWSLWH